MKICIQFFKLHTTLHNVTKQKSTRLNTTRDHVAKYTQLSNTLQNYLKLHKNYYTCKETIQNAIQLYNTLHNFTKQETLQHFAQLFNNDTQFYETHTNLYTTLNTFHIIAIFHNFTKLHKTLQDFTHLLQKNRTLHTT